MSDYSEILFERQGRVGLLTLHRPQKRNAFTLQMWEELRHLGDRLLVNPGELAVVIVRGSGGVFSSGIVTSLLTTPALSSGTVDVEKIQAAYRWLRQSPFITLAAIEKYAIGAGLELALWCDIRLATTGTQFALPELDFGIIPDLGGCSLLPEVVGYSRAMELIVSARRFDANEAHHMGLIQEVVSPEAWTARLEYWQQRLSGLSLSALRGAKQSALASLPDTSRSEQLSRMNMAQCLREALQRQNPA
ncbi:MAG TPA: enoyl-CoA hydratase/isomerase family protein [Gemmatales bacterium]|nr:enoyl-CoA hydratase/isomerase family protein [Gemmatales bacterium]